MSSRTSRRIHVHMPSTKPKRRMGSASPQMRKKGQSQRNSKKHRHHGGAIIVDNGAKPKQRVCRDRQISTENHQVEIHREEWEAYKCELNNLASWLAAAAHKSSRWMAPTNNILSIRVILERHLASAMELETHQHQKDTVLLKGLDLIRQYPQLASELEATLLAIDAQFVQLGQRLEQQFIEIEDALECATASINKGRKKGELCLNLEQAKDTLDQMALRLRSRKRRNSPMQTNIQALNRQVGAFNTSGRLSPTRHEPVQQTSQQQPSMASTLSSTPSSTLSSTISSGTTYSSSMDFDALYEELSDWLKEMQVAVSDSNNLGVSEMRIEHMCKGYEQELQMREVSRSKLERKARKLMAANPNQANEIANKLETINYHWKALQARLNPQCTPRHIEGARHGVKPTHWNASQSSEEAVSVVVEVEDIIVKLKAWLIGMERRLFAAESITCPGNVEEMEKRLVAHKELQQDIKKHAEGIQVVLTMCDILQKDQSSTDKEGEALQLAAINLERRWEAIQAQARDLQCSLEEKIRIFKGPEAISSTPATEPSKPEEIELATEAEEDSPFLLSLSSPIKSLAAVHKLFRPSAAKDDDAVDGYTRAIEKFESGIDYEYLQIREAFSENDAFSMSETSDVCEFDFDFDDVLPMKKGDDEEELLGACGSSPSDCGTPDIMDMSDGMLDEYLRMEEEILMQEELWEDEVIGTPIQRKRNQSSASDLEFWSMSPRDDPMISSMESRNSLDFDNDAVVLHAGESGYRSRRSLEYGMMVTYPPMSSSLPAGDRGSLPEIVCTAGSAPTTFEPLMCRYTPGTFDAMSLAAQDAFDNFGSSDEEDYGGDAEDNGDAWDELKHDVTGTQNEMEEQEIFAFEDNFETPTKDDFKKPATEDLKTNSKDDLKTKGGLYDDDYDQVPTKDIKQHHISSPLLTTLSFKPQKTSFFPPIITSSSAPLDWSTVPVPRDPIKPLMVKPLYKKSKSLFPSIFDEDDFTAVQEALSDDAEKEGIQNQKQESELLQLRKSLNSSLGPMITKKKLFPDLLTPPTKFQKDDLLEITDLSLSHMCESLDFMTELAHWIMPVHRDNDPPVKDTNDRAASPPTRDTSNSRNQQHQSQQQAPTQHSPDSLYQYRPYRQTSGTPSPSLSFEDLFEDHSDSTKPNVAELNSSSDKRDISDTETESSLSTHESDEKPTHDSAVPLHNQRKTSIENSNLMHVIDESETSPRLNVADTSIGSIDLPEFNQPGDEELEEVSSNPGSSTPSHGDIPDRSLQESPILGTSEPFSSEVDTQEGEDTGEEQQAYFTYVSDLAEACSQGELTRYFGNYHHQKCHMWSLGLSDPMGFPSPSPEEEDILAEVEDLEKRIADAELEDAGLLSVSDLETESISMDDALETLSQCSGDTDKLMEASDELVKELQDRRRLQMDPLPESEIGSWRDVIVLWLKENEESDNIGSETPVQSEEASVDEETPTNISSEEDQASAPENQEDKDEPSCDITDSGVWTASPSTSMVAASAVTQSEIDITEADSGLFSEPSEEGSPIRNISPKHAPILDTLPEDQESLSAVDDDDEEDILPPQEMDVETTVITEDKAISATPEKKPPSFLRRVLRAAFPFQILMIFYIVMVLILPSIVINSNGECQFSMTDRLMFNGQKWVPTVRYTRGPPPV